MGFFKINTSEENIKDYAGNDTSKFINKSGIYEVILKSVIVDTSKGGSDHINLWIEYQGQEQPIFQAMRITNKDGSANIVGQQMFTRLAVVCGASDGDDIPDAVKRMIPIGKDGEEKECMVLEIFDDQPIYIRIQMEYDLYENKIRQNKVVRNVFRYEDKATAMEIVNDTEKGLQFTKEEEYADKISYKGGLTEEDVQEWIKNRKTDKKEEPKKPAGGFGTKRFGNK